MDPARELALKLAHDSAALPDAVVKRAAAYRDFLNGQRDAEIIAAAQHFASKVSACRDAP